MRLSFTVEVVLEIPDKIVEAVLHEVGDVDGLSVGHFGELVLKGAKRGVKLESFTTGQYVEVLRN